MQTEQFLSTPSARRATENSVAMNYNSAISIHALREESDSGYVFSCSRKCTISIHALREESDVESVENAHSAYKISIHALREESDCVTW